ncbi:hypothetical protein ACJJI4_21360 [Microbulbifer sp. TRSA002]|uniref:hypothetical protein n=1 Tax=Microbulbifer sp. TRSA002 TaxID=3243382 RepID=UPI0040396605
MIEDNGIYGYPLCSLEREGGIAPPYLMLIAVGFSRSEAESNAAFLKIFKRNCTI